MEKVFVLFLLLQVFLEVKIYIKLAIGHKYICILDLYNNKKELI
jgi:hypothetical protein